MSFSGESINDFSWGMSPMMDKPRTMCGMCEIRFAPR